MHCNTIDRGWYFYINSKQLAKTWFLNEQKLFIVLFVNAVSALLQKWKKEKEDEIKIKLAESAKYKSYRRYMKNHGPGQITLDDM